MGNFSRNFMLWILIAGGLFLVFNMVGGEQKPTVELSYSELQEQAAKGRIASVEISPTEYSLIGQYQGGDRKKFSTNLPPDYEGLLTTLTENGVKVEIDEVNTSGGFWRNLLISALPILILVGIFFYFMRQMQGKGGGGAMSFGRSRAKLMNEDDIRVTFADVAGVEEAKEEVSELVEFLRDPSKFQKLGGKIPRGVLMVGSPGTGKTLLAKAIAGEAKVPFFSISGSDFVEMFVGVGASRVRDMFEQARKKSPCIIFIDEIDAVGRHRGAGMGGGHDEREQTLNQLLVEMDGFEAGEGIIVIAATNRPDVLDPALLRPGRFDRQVVVPLPDILGREQILKVHMTKIPANKDVNASVIARGTPGFSGADLANLVNEAALMAARKNLHTVGMNEFEQAKDKILMGAERRSMVMSEEDKLMTAYHEAGHTIVGCLVPGYDPIYKVTIIPRGQALGVTMPLPVKDRYSTTQEWLNSFIAMAFGGRIAEALIYGEDQISTGASNDIKQATGRARSMVTEWGFSESLGPILYAEEQGEIFLGRSMAQQKHVSEDTAKKIDEEVRGIIDRNYNRAEKILKDNIDKLHAMADALMKYETIGEPQIAAILKGEVPPPPAGWEGSSNSSGKSGGSGNQVADAQATDAKDDTQPSGKHSSDAKPSGSSVDPLGQN